MREESTVFFHWDANSVLDLVDVSKLKEKICFSEALSLSSFNV